MNKTLIDQKSLDEFTEYDREMLADLAVIFGRALPDYLARMDHSIADSNPDSLCEVAHQLRSQLSYFFCEPLVNLTMEIEELGRQREINDAKIIAANLRHGITDLLAELNQLTGLNLSIEED